MGVSPRDIENLGGSEELRTIQESLVRTSAVALNEILALNETCDLEELDQRLKSRGAPTVFEVLERCERLKPSEEHLHSRLLEFLFTRDRDISDAFLSSVIQEARFYRDGLRTTVVGSRSDRGDIKIEREAQVGEGRDKADFRIRSKRHNFVLIIENKIWAGEGPLQLQKYWEKAQSDDPGFAVGGLFLTPDARKPATAGKYDFVPVGYARIADLPIRRAVKVASRKMWSLQINMLRRLGGGLCKIQN